LGDHLPIKVSDWHSSISGLHGANIIPIVNHIGKKCMSFINVNIKRNNEYY